MPACHNLRVKPIITKTKTSINKIVAFLINPPVIKMQFYLNYYHRANFLKGVALELFKKFFKSFNFFFEPISTSGISKYKKHSKTSHQGWRQYRVRVVKEQTSRPKDTKEPASVTLCITSAILIHPATLTVWLISSACLKAIMHDTQAWYQHFVHSFPCYFNFHDSKIVDISNMNTCGSTFVPPVLYCLFLLFCVSLVSLQEGVYTLQSNNL